jgi:hypothetical protein
MSITYTDVKKDEWEIFKKNGGSITFEIDGVDISANRDFETDPIIQSKLTTGFELPPTPLISSPDLQALIQVYGSEWDYIFCRIYISGGKVIYRKLANGKYEATCSVDLT